MPADPRELQQLVADPRFQALGPEDQIAHYRGFLAEQDPEEFGRFSHDEQITVTQDALQRLTPGWGSAVADVAEYVPVVGGAVRGYREPEVRPLTGAIFGQPETTAGRMGAEVARDVGELGAAVGITKLAMPAINALTTRLVGGTIEGALFKQGSGALADEALGAATSAASRKIAGEAARIALREKWVRRGLEQIPQAGLFGATMALEGEIANGELPPLGDILATTAGAAALGMGFYAAGDLVRKFGLKSMDEVVGAHSKFDPERFASVQRNVSEAAEAIRRASGGTLDRAAAADLTLTALTDPLDAVADIAVIKNALRTNPELLGSEVGLRLLRTQRKILDPDITIVGPTRIDGRSYQPDTTLRVTYDDVDGRTVTEDLSTPAAQKQFASKVKGGQITVSSAMGDEASIVRAGVRQGSLIEPVLGPGGRGTLAPEARTIDTWSGPVRNLPVPREPTLGDIAEQAGRELRGRGPLQQPVELNVVGIKRGAAAPEPVGAMAHAESATSPEAIARLDRERAQAVTYAAVDVRGKGKERVLPATVDRVDQRPAPYEIIVKRGGTARDVIVEAGAKVTPAQVQRVRAAEVKRFEAEVTARSRAPQPAALPAPDVQQGVLRPDGTRVFAEGIQAPPKGAVVKTTTGLDVTVLDDADAIGRALIELPGGQRVRTQYDPRLRAFEVPDWITTLPARESGAPPLTGEVRVPTPALRAQIQAGQVIHQTARDLARRKAQPSIEVLVVEGDRVLVRSGDKVVETDLATVARTIESGADQFGFDMTKMPLDAAEAIGNRFRDAAFFGENKAAPRLTPEQLAKESQIASELYAFNQRVGQAPAPGTTGPDPNVNLRATAEKQNQTPKTQRSRGGSRLVKGCKPV